MKRITFYISLLGIVALLWAGATIVEFKAEPGQNKIILQWKTSHEQNVVKFVVERAGDNRHFVAIGEVNARGPGFTYRFVDDQLGKVQNMFYYRLRIVDSDGSYQFTDSLPVIYNISGISRSWGSIKALFR